MWQNVQAYRTVTNNPCPHIDAELLLVCTQDSFGYNEQIKRFLTLLIRTLSLVAVYGTRTQSLSAPFSHTLYI
jgi:hypothetical protein